MLDMQCKYAYQCVNTLISQICIVKVCILVHIPFEKSRTHFCQTLMIILTYTHWTSILELQKNATSHTICWNAQKSQEKKIKGQTFSTPLVCIQICMHSNLYAKRPTKEASQYGIHSCNILKSLLLICFPTTLLLFSYLCKMLIIFLVYIVLIKKLQ